MKIHRFRFVRAETEKDRDSDVVSFRKRTDRYFSCYRHAPLIVVVIIVVITYRAGDDEIRHRPETRVLLKIPRVDD